MEVLLNTADIQNASNQLKDKASELEAAIQVAENAISPLRTFRSPNIERNLSTWDDVKRTCLIILENLIDSADEIARAAEANEGSNQ
jgi:hypothetical protein